MLYLAVLTFDLDSDSQDLYDNLNEGLADIGLKKELQASSGKTVQLPSNTYAGKIAGIKQAQVYEMIVGQVEEIFSDNGAHGRIFLTVSGGSPCWMVKNL